MVRNSYPTDLTDMEWEILAPLIPAAKSGGHPRATSGSLGLDSTFVRFSRDMHIYHTGVCMKFWYKTPQLL